MKAIRVLPRATQILRSVMIAGAGTAIWMALSATAASADSGTPDNHSLLGGVTSSVSSTVSSVKGTVNGVTTQASKSLGPTTSAVKNAGGSVAKAAVPKPSAPVVTIPVPDVPLPAPVKAVVPKQSLAVHVPAVTPVVKEIAKSEDEVIAAVPVINRAVPSHTVGTVVDAVAAPTTGKVDETVEAVAPPVNHVLEPVGLDPVTDVTNPVVKPIIDVVDTVLPPVSNILPPVVRPGSIVPPLLGGVGAILPEKPAVGALPPSGVVVSSVVASPADAPDDGLSTASTDVPLDTTPPSLRADVTSVLGGSRGLVAASTGATSGASVASDPGTPTEMPTEPDAAPMGVTGTGSGTSQNGPPSPAAAFLHGALIVPVDELSGPASASNEQHPKPVSFDPGSSPD